MVKCRVRLKNWDATGHLFRYMRPKIEEESERVMEECQKIYYNEVMRLIEEGEPSWEPLKDKWVSSKGHGGFYRYTGDFVTRGIESRRVKAGGLSGEERVFIGASNYTLHRRGITMAQLAGKLQYNSDYNRPLFGPAWENVKDEITAKLAKIGVSIIE